MVAEGGFGHVYAGAYKGTQGHGFMANERMADEMVVTRRTTTIDNDDDIEGCGSHFYFAVSGRCE